MPLVFTNGTIHTLDPLHALVEWVVVEGGRVREVGRGRPPAGGRFDLEGRTLLPGLQDAHVHPPSGGLTMLRCDLHALGTLDEFQAAVRAYASPSDAPWILGGGWSMDSLPGGIGRAEWLDEVVADRPVFLMSSEGHAAWVNTQALQIAGITPATPDPADGRIERDPDGSPNGTLQEGAADLVGRWAPPATPEDIERAILGAQRLLFTLGITGWQDAWVEPDAHEAYRRLAGAGTLRASVVGALWWDRVRGIEQLDEILESSRGGVGRYRPAAVKLMVDGVCENGTAALHDPYVGTDDTGLTFLDRPTLLAAVPRIMAAGLQPHFHAIGDRAICSALDAVAAGNGAAARAVRPHIAHIQVVDPADIPRFAALGVTANAQAYWACNDATMRDLTAPRLGPERTAWQYPFRDLLDAGARIAGGSDWSVSTADPFEQMAVAITRRLDDAPPFRPDQAITPAEAIQAFTTGSAFVMHRDGESGTISPGKAADLVVASADPLAEPDLAAIRVDATFVAGEAVFVR